MLNKYRGIKAPVHKFEKNMYITQIIVTPTEKGESLEEMVRRVTANNEPIESSAPMIYTEKADEVLPQYDIRTDRFDLALDAIDKVQKSEIARTNEKVEKPATQEQTTEIDY